MSIRKSVINSKIINHKIGKINANYTVNGRHKLLKSHEFAKFINCKFYSLTQSIGSFSKLKGKEVFVKKSACGVCDCYQLSDYLKQRKLTSLIPEVYGYVKSKSGIYIFSESINDAISINDLFNKSIKHNNLALNNKLLNSVKSRLKEDIKKSAKKLIINGLLPWDFKLRQFFYSPSRKRIYFADNSVAFVNPVTLKYFFKKCNLKVPKYLDNLCKVYNLTPGPLIRNTLRKASKTPSNKGLLENKGKLTTLKRKISHKLNNNVFTDKLSVKVADFYNALPLNIKITIQNSILEEILQEIESIN